jgi:chromate transporter
MNDVTRAPRAPEPAAAPPRPGLSELFTAYALISLYGFGGVLAWSRRMMVEERRWLTPEQFNEAYALCSFLPGPNIVNFSVIFGSRVRGPLGGLVALAGLLGPPMTLIVVRPLRRSADAAARADRRHRSGGRPDHVDRGQDGAAAVP